MKEKQKEMQIIRDVYVKKNEFKAPEMLIILIPEHKRFLKKLAK